jgi:hypothetical protein
VAGAILVSRDTTGDRVSVVHDKSVRLLGQPVYKPDEEHATARVLNAKKRMDPVWSKN